MLSSASSKTAYAAAFELHGRGPRLIGLTSPGNLAFTRSLGCYDEVLAYDDIAALDAVPTVYLDLSGAPAHRAALRAHLGDRLVRDVAVGLTQQTPNADAADGGLLRARSRCASAAGTGAGTGSTTGSPTPGSGSSQVVSGWVDVRVGTGPEALRDAWLDVLAGRTPPRVGHVVQL